MESRDMGDQPRPTGPVRAGKRRVWRTEHVLVGAVLAASCVPRVHSHMATLTPFGFLGPMHGLSMRTRDLGRRSAPFLRKKMTWDFDEELVEFVHEFLGDTEALRKPTEGTSSSTAPVKRRRATAPTFAWEHADGGMVLRAATPGLKKEDLSIKMVDEGAQRYLVVSGGTKDPAAEEHAKGAGDGTGKGNDADKDKTAAPNQDTVSHAPKPSTPSDEYYYAAFEHRVRLPADVTGDCLAASYEDGMLTIRLTLPAEKPTQSETIPIA